MEVNNIPTFVDPQVWSINRFSKCLSSKGVKMMGWNDITGDNIRNEAHIEQGQSEKLAEGTIVHFWDGDISLVNKAIDKGYDVVNSNRHFTYLDYPYEVILLERTYSFNPILEVLDCWFVTHPHTDPILAYWGRYWKNPKKSPSGKLYNLPYNDSSMAMRVSDPIK